MTLLYLGQVILFCLSSFVMKLSVWGLSASRLRLFSQSSHQPMQRRCTEYSVQMLRAGFRYSSIFWWGDSDVHSVVLKLWASTCSQAGDMWADAACAQPCVQSPSQLQPWPSRTAYRSYSTCNICNIWWVLWKASASYAEEHLYICSNHTPAKCSRPSNILLNQQPEQVIIVLITWRQGLNSALC